MRDLHSWQQRLRPFLAPPAALRALAMRLRAGMFARGLAPSWNSPVPTVGVGSMDSLVRGKVMVSAWLAGWARAKGIEPALITGLRGAAPETEPLRVDASTPVRECGVEAALLARYRPGVPILADRDPVRAGKSLMKNKDSRPGLLILHDHFSSLRVRRGADILLLGALDLDKGWNRCFPAGAWREGVRALERASAFVLTLRPEELTLRGKLVERRLGRYGKPVFTIHPRIWRLKDSQGNPAPDLGGEPYLLVAAESNQDMAAKAAQEFLKLPPRLRLIFPDSHRFTSEDIKQIAADAERMRAPHVLATPEAALILGDVPGRTLWTYDPDVVLGPCTATGVTFAAWWESAWAGLSGA